MADNSVPEGGQFGIFSEHFAATKKQRTIFGGLSAKFGRLSAKFGGLSKKKFYSTDPRELPLHNMIFLTTQKVIFVINWIMIYNFALLYLVNPMK